MNFNSLILAVGFVVSVASTVATGAFVFGLLAGKHGALAAQVQGLMGDNRELSRRIDGVEKALIALRRDLHETINGNPEGGLNAKRG